MNRLKPGQTIGTCKIEGFVAEGGMATVYRAHQTLMDKKVAVKVLQPKHLEDQTALAGFLKEGMAGARLTHPSITQVYYTAEENGVYYIVMDFVDGDDLKSILREGGPLPLRKALEITRKVAEVLAFSHDRGIVHRDIKPGNVMIDRSGEVILTDFGIASLLYNSTRSDQHKKETSGTPAYMSPEQFRGEVIDERSDLYSLGATLHSLLTGSPPFKASNVKDLAKLVLKEPLPPLRQKLPNAPRKVIKLLERLLAKEPNVRYRTARDVVMAMDESLFEKSAPRVVLPTLTTRFKWRKSFWWPVLFSVAGLWIFSIFLFFAMSWAAPSIPRERRSISLENRLESFSNALREGNWNKVLSLIEPEKRENPHLCNSLRSLLKVVKSTTPRSQGRYTVLSQRDGVVYTFVYVKDPDVHKTLRVSLAWRESPEGAWYIHSDETHQIPFQQD